MIKANYRILVVKLILKYNNKRNINCVKKLKQQMYVKT